MVKKATDMVKNCSVMPTARGAEGTKTGKVNKMNDMVKNRSVMPTARGAEGDKKPSR